MKREHRTLMAEAKKRGMDGVVWRMLCILENVHGIEYALRAASAWPSNALKGKK